MPVSDKSFRKHHGGLGPDVELACLDSASLRKFQIDVIRRFATIVALIATVVAILLLVFGIDNWRVSLGLTCLILICVICGAAKNRSRGQPSRQPYLHPLYTGFAGGSALIGVGMHSNAGVLVAAGALLALIRFPLPPLRLIIIALAAVGPWVVEAVAGARGTGSMLLGLLVIAVVTLIWVRSRDVNVLVVSLCLTTTLYVAAAVLLFWLGIRAEYSDVYLTQDVTSFGPFTFRWRLPLSGSWVTVPIVATIGTALCVWVLRIDRRRIGPGAGPIKLMCAAGLVLNLIAVVAANGRTQLVAALVGAVVASGVLPKSVRNGLAFASTALWLAPVWWNRIAGARDSVVTTMLVEYMPSRGSAERTVTLQGRTLIWDISLAGFGRGSLVEQVAGWGPDGHIASGAAAEYSGVLGGAYRSSYYPPHNALLEVLLSGGLTLAAVVLIGIIFVIAMQVNVLRHGPAPTAAGIAALSITLAAGAFSEVALLPSNAQPAAIAAPLVTIVTLAAYSQSVLTRRRRNDTGSPSNRHSSLMPQNSPSTSSG